MDIKKDIKNFIEKIIMDLYDNGLNPAEIQKSILIEQLNKYLNKDITYNTMIVSILQAHPWRTKFFKTYESAEVNN